MQEVYTLPRRGMAPVLILPMNIYCLGQALCCVLRTLHETGFYTVIVKSSRGDPEEVIRSVAKVTNEKNGIP